MSLRKKTTHKKNTGGKRSDARIKKDIERAVDAIPGLVTKHASNESAAPYYQEPRHATLLTWAGAATVMGFILVLWAWNARTIITDVLSSPSQELEILANTRGEFDAVLAAVSAQNSTTTMQTTTTLAMPTTKEKISQILATVALAASTGTSTSATTTGN